MPKIEKTDDIVVQPNDGVLGSATKFDSNPQPEQPKEIKNPPLQTSANNGDNTQWRGQGGDYRIDENGTLVKER